MSLITRLQHDLESLTPEQVYAHILEFGVWATGSRQSQSFLGALGYHSATSPMKKCICDYLGISLSELNKLSRHASKSTESFKKYCSERNKSWWNDPSYRQNRADRASLYLKKKWQDKEAFRQRRQNQISGGFDRLEKLLHDNHVELVESFTGLAAHYGKGDFPYENKKYLVRCLRCGFEYQTTLNSSIRVCPSCSKKGHRSRREIHFESYITSLGFRVEANARGYITSPDGRPYEIDLYLPELKIGFEFNGLYWHSSLYHSPDYHQNKAGSALRQGIRLYFLWEDSSDVFCERFIRRVLGVKPPRVIRAHKCFITASKCLSSSLIQSEHRAGNSSLGIKYNALIYNGIVVAAISFSWNKNHWEIARYVVNHDYTVHGAFLKLLKAAAPYLKERSSQLITYCDRDLSPDPKNTVYARSGFHFLGDSGPEMWYYVTSRSGFKPGKYQRHKFQKHKLPDYWDDVDMTMSETEICFSHGVFQVYNSGDWKYQIDLEEI